MLKDYIKEKNWIFEEQNKEKLNEISQKYNLPECVSALVLNRCEEDAEPYIENGISSFLNPFFENSPLIVYPGPPVPFPLGSPP